MLDDFKVQLQAIVDEYENACKRSQYEYPTDVLTRADIARLQTQSKSAIARIAGTNSVYFRQASANTGAIDKAWQEIPSQIGAVQALLHDIDNDYLKTVSELIHGDVFGDFLEMADHLLQNCYKDAAAVIAGSTLEAHIHQLCVVNNIETNPKGKPAKASFLNDSLARESVYSKLDQKNVTAWLDLRNDAAHGHYDKYEETQVRLLVDSIRNFITRHPA